MVMRPFFESPSFGKLGLVWSLQCCIQKLYTSSISFLFFLIFWWKMSSLFFSLHHLHGVACFCFLASTTLPMKELKTFFTFILHCLSLPPIPFCKAFYKGWIHAFLSFGFRVVNPTCGSLSFSGSRHGPNLCWFYRTYGSFMGCHACYYDTHTSPMWISKDSWQTLLRLIGT